MDLWNDIESYLPGMLYVEKKEKIKQNYNI